MLVCCPHCKKALKVKDQTPPAPEAFADVAKYGMTKAQGELFTFILSYMKSHGGISPSFDEMRDAMGLQSKSGIHRMIVAMEQRGIIRRIPHSWRSIQLSEAT